jgi:hypothetical protein
MKHTFKFITVCGLLSVSALFSTSCNDWLDLLPNNEQVTDNYWQSKEDVESVLASGYYYMRNAVPQMLLWGELRGGTLFNNSTTDEAGKIQDFDAVESNSQVKYSTFYQIINMANSVLMYAPGVQNEDDTYYASVLNSHLCEAYFQRAFAYSILVKNYKEVPLILEAYVNDDAEFNLPKSSETQIIEQIKADCEAALATGAAKSNYEEEWETKGRATKWAIYALLADITLWNHEYDLCIQYCNELIDASDALRPVFISEMTNWYSIFNPGNSNESIFELNWNYATEGTNNNFASRFAFGNLVSASTGNYNISPTAVEKMRQECTSALANHPELTYNDHVGRSIFCTWVPGVSTDAPSRYATSQNYYVWKYRGQELANIESVRLSTGNDANFILYRMADVYLMKAEALVMKGQSSWRAAIELINKVRVRAGLSEYLDLTSSTANDEIEALDELTLLTEVMDQREMEFVGEAKRWYDLLRMARYDSDFAPSQTVEDTEGQTYGTYKNVTGQDVYEYKQKVIQTICEYNTQISSMQLQSILQNSWAWYLPLPLSDIETNDNLKQNPYYATTK